MKVEDRDPCKQKKKTKERKELWDSLLEVYEKEVRTFVVHLPTPALPADLLYILVTIVVLVNKS